MTREEAIDVLTKNLKCERIADDCNLRCSKCDLFVKSDLVVDASAVALEALKSQKVGKWVKNSNGGLLSWYCSECSTPTAMGTMQYCYHCGAKMEVEE